MPVQANSNIKAEDIQYTLGRGKLLIRDSGGGDGEWLDFMNITEFGLSINNEILDHFTSRGGLKKLDRSTVTQQTAEGTFTCDSPTVENLKIFLQAGATDTDTSQASSSGATKNDVVAKHNRWIDLGKVNVSNVVVNGDGGSPTHVLNTDYILNAKEGFVGILEDGGISNNDVLDITFDHAAKTRTRIDASQIANQKKEFLFLGDPAEGVRMRLKGFGNIIPNGDLGAITDEWLGFGFTLKLEESSAINGLFEYEELEV